MEQKDSLYQNYALENKANIRKYFCFPILDSIKKRRVNWSVKYIISEGGK